MVGRFESSCLRRTTSDLVCVGVSQPKAEDVAPPSERLVVHHLACLFFVVRRGQPGDIARVAHNDVFETFHFVIDRTRIAVRDWQLSVGR